MHSLTSALDRGEWSALHPGHFTPRERALHSIMTTHNSPSEHDMATQLTIVILSLLCWRNVGETQAKLQKQMQHSDLF
jgi:hypothetical protein